MNTVERKLKESKQACAEIIAERQRRQLLKAQLNCKFSIQVGQPIKLPTALKQQSAPVHKWRTTS